jgi:indolepyruvate ferredoxin oxidoreductase
MMMLGYACQSGELPIGPEALLRAIELNGQAVETNQEAFTWGRLAAHDPARVAAVADAGDGADLDDEPVPDTTPLDDLVGRRAAFLVDYQDEAYARRYRDFVAMVAGREAAATGTDDLARAVARYYFKLLAYKDEYEVARLYTDGTFRAQLEAEFSGDYTLRLNLAPQIFNRRHARTNRARKHTYGPWIFPALKVLAAGKKVRGTRADLFGRTAHRREERALIAQYESTVAEVLGALRPETHDLAVEVVSLPEHIRGFDSVKDQGIAWARAETERLLGELRAPQPEPVG